MPLHGNLALGPVLHIGRCDETHWRFAINILFHTGHSLEDYPELGCPLTMRVTEEGVSIEGPIPLADLRHEGAQYLAWRWEVEVQRTDKERWISYDFKSEEGWVISKIIGRAKDIEATDLAPWERIDGVCIPALGRLPRIAAHSCSWFSSADLEKDSKNIFGRWEGLFKRHLDRRKQPLTDLPGGFHLQIGGGDQIYADTLLKHDFIDQLWNKPDLPAPQGTPERALERYLELYATRWSAPAMAKVLARIPGIYTWDDHEIMDGWGSYSDDQQTAPGRQVIWKAARRAFEVVQLGARADHRYPSFPKAGLPRGLPRPEPLPAAHGPKVEPHYLQKLSFETPKAELHLLLLDLRSERSMERVMAAEHQWKDLEAALAKLEASAAEAPKRHRHLILVSSIPPLFLSAAAKPEVVLRLIPRAQEFEDDLRDQWESAAHREERLKLLERLFLVSKRAKCRVTILSGDIHVGAYAKITDGGGEASEIAQLVTSGMVHPAPGWIGQIVVEFASGLQGASSFGGTIEGQLQKIDEKDFFLTKENYLQIRFDDPEPDNPERDKARLYAMWITQKGALNKHKLVIPPRPSSPGKPRVVG